MAAPRHVLLYGSTASRADAIAGSTGWRITVAPAGDLLETFRTGEPDAALLSEPDFRAHGPALLAVRHTPIVCIGSDLLGAASCAIDHGACGWLSEPATTTVVAAQLELAIRWTERLEALTNEKQMLMQMLETRKLVERAKAIFMRRLNLDEPTAHKRLQQESQNRRIALAELARRIIESDEMLASDVAGPMSAN